MTESHRKIHSRSVVQQFKETIESLIIAFILAFVFRAFVVEAFVIPTGSMADTLRGAHFRLTCQKCGYQYNFGFVPERYRHAATGRYFTKGYFPPNRVFVTDSLRMPPPICPTCGTQIDNSYPRRVSNGDRILVLKYLYQFKEPDIWDVVVFKNPIKPEENYIKRLIGRPGDTVEVIDGDVYIASKDNDFQPTIQPKPQHVQDALWLVAFDNNYQLQDHQARDIWKQPFTPTRQDSPWSIDQRRHVFEFKGSKELDSLHFNPQRLNKLLESFCAYNGPNGIRGVIVSDLKLEFILTPLGNKGKAIVQLGKYGRTYSGIINFDGSCSIVDDHSGTVVAQEQLTPLIPNQPVIISFTNVDHRLELTLGKNKLSYIGPNSAQEWGFEPTGNPLPTVSLAGVGAPFTLEDIILYRDTHYTNAADEMASQGTQGNPFTLGEDEFFVMGDNSPHSFDSRLWYAEGLGNGNKRYRRGTVPRDYLIGKAFFVYWPAGFHPHPKTRFALIPNVGNMRFIH